MRKVKVTYKNLQTGRIGTPIHTLPLNLGGYDSVEKYLVMEVYNWNIHNSLLSWQYVDSSIEPSHIPKSTLAIRDTEISEIWSPKLKQIYLNTCQKLNKEPDSEWIEKIVIKYNHHYTDWAHILLSRSPPLIEVGHKFFTLTPEVKEKALEHEFSHKILNYKCHSGDAASQMRKSEIILCVPTEFDFHRRNYKYAIYCYSCNKEVYHCKNKQKIIKEIESNPKRFSCKRCGNSNLKVKYR